MADAEMITPNEESIRELLELPCGLLLHIPLSLAGLDEILRDVAPCTVPISREAASMPSSLHGEPVSNLILLFAPQDCMDVRLFECSMSRGDDETVLPVPVTPNLRGTLEKRGRVYLGIPANVVATLGPGWDRLSGLVILLCESDAEYVEGVKQCIKDAKEALKRAARGVLPTSSLDKKQKGPDGKEAQ